MALYNIFIVPLIYFFETLVLILNRFVSNPVLLLFIVSFIVNFLSYPVFKKIETLCNKDKDDYQKLLPKINSIKANFSGSERRMLLATYFRQNNYHPLFVRFKQSLTVFLYVPIFMASYVVVSENPVFDIEKINKINEVFSPVRILPIVMTLINVFSVRIYTKNKPDSNQFYSYALPFLFLALLYFSPASVVLYWIFNNSFALLRNVYFYMKNRIGIIFFGYVVTVMATVFYVRFDVNLLWDLLHLSLLFFIGKIILQSTKHSMCMYAVFVFSIVYIIMHVFGVIPLHTSILPFVLTVLFVEIIIIIYRFFIKDSCFAVSFKNLFLVLFSFFVFFSIYTPLKIVNSAPEEVYSVIDFKDLIFYEIETGIGMFLFYPMIVFCLQKQCVQKNIYWGTVVLLSIALLEACIFKLPSDVINVYMQFQVEDGFISRFSDITEFLLIICVVISVSLIFKYNLLKKFNLFVLALGVVGLGFSVVEGGELYANGQNLTKKETTQPKLTLTSTGKNVLILFMDRAISSFFPKVMEEKPELKKIYTGFVYYPYTVSFAPHTLYSTPSLLGGYEYTPMKLQNDTTRKMVDKHNEAISVLPEMFRRNGYDVSLINLPYINYDDNKKDRFFHEDINVINNFYKMKRMKDIVYHIKKNVFYFTLCKFLPGFYKNLIYNRGKYVFNKGNASLSKNMVKKELKKLHGFFDSLEVSPKASDSFYIFVSELPHNPTFLSGDYVLTEDVEKNVDMTTGGAFYHINMLSYLELKKLLLKLKENNVYDNTRIIIVSDHGYWIYADGVAGNLVQNNALLLIKDFNAEGTYKTSSEFMTLADTAALAAGGLINPIINPMTGVKMFPEKENGADIITTRLKKWSPRHYPDKDRTYLYNEDVEFFHVDQNNIKEIIKIKQEAAEQK